MNGLVNKANNREMTVACPAQPLLICKLSKSRTIRPRKPPSSKRRCAATPRPPERSRLPAGPASRNLLAETGDRCMIGGPLTHADEHGLDAALEVTVVPESQVDDWAVIADARCNLLAQGRRIHYRIDACRERLAHTRGNVVPARNDLGCTGCAQERMSFGEAIATMHSPSSLPSATAKVPTAPAAPLSTTPTTS